MRQMSRIDDEAARPGSGVNSGRTRGRPDRIPPHLSQTCSNPGMVMRETGRRAPRPDSADTVRLLDRAAGGDRAAVNDLLARSRDDLRVVVRHRLDQAVRTRVDSSDLVQEAQAEMARRLPDFLVRRPMPFHLWARRLAYQRVLNARRDHRAGCRDVAREEGPDPTSLALAAALVDPRPSPASAAQAAELAEQVAALIDGLPEADREVLLMRQAEHLPFAEIAVLLDVEPAAARQRYGRALIRLQQALRGAGVVGGEP